MISLREKNGFRCGGFDVFNDRTLVSGFSLKSSAEDTVNFALHTGDNPVRVLRTRQRFFPIFGIDSGPIISPLQVHGDGLFIPGPQDRGRGAVSCGGLPEADAVILSHAGLSGLILTADCIPFFVRVPGRPLAALVHAGWKGARLRILHKTIRLLITRYGADPGKILIASGPHIRPCCYGVQDDFLPLFPERFFTRKGTEAHFDLLGASLEGVRELGILKKHILDAGFCTVCRPDLFPSYRRDRTIFRMASFLSLR